MLRTILLTLLNIALPFLLRGLYIYALRLFAKRQQKKGMVDVTPPEWHFPVAKLVIIGLALSIVSIAVLRFTTTEIDTPYKGNTVKSERL
tara:strand:- start:54927 stop:55196 length:270 start_codon:yes stop_codon:yes gene_type:complete